MTVSPFEGDLLVTEAMAVSIVEMERRGIAPREILDRHAERAFGGRSRMREAEGKAAAGASLGEVTGSYGVPEDIVRWACFGRRRPERTAA